MRPEQRRASSTITPPRTPPRPGAHQASDARTKSRPHTEKTPPSASEPYPEPMQNTPTPGASGTDLEPRRLLRSKTPPNQGGDNDLRRQNKNSAGEISNEDPAMQRRHSSGSLPHATAAALQASSSSSSVPKRHSTGDAKKTAKKPVDLQAEVDRLREENSELRKQHEILEKRSTAAQGLATKVNMLVEEFERREEELLQKIRELESEAERAGSDSTEVAYLRQSLAKAESMAHAESSEIFQARQATRSVEDHTAALEVSVARSEARSAQQAQELQRAQEQIGIYEGLLLRDTGPTGELEAEVRSYAALEVRHEALEAEYRKAIDEADEARESAEQIEQLEDAETELEAMCTEATSSEAAWEAECRSVESVADTVKERLVVELNQAHVATEHAESRAREARRSIGRMESQEMAALSAVEDSTKARMEALEESAKAVTLRENKLLKERQTIQDLLRDIVGYDAADAGSGGSVGEVNVVDAGGQEMFDPNTDVLSLARRASFAHEKLQRQLVAIEDSAKITMASMEDTTKAAKLREAKWIEQHEQVRDILQLIADDYDKGSDDSGGELAPSDDESGNRFDAGIGIVSLARRASRSHSQMQRRLQVTPSKLENKIRLSQERERRKSHDFLKEMGDVEEMLKKVEASEKELRSELKAISELLAPVCDLDDGLLYAIRCLISGHKDSESLLVHAREEEVESARGLQEEREAHKTLYRRCSTLQDVAAAQEDASSTAVNEEATLVRELRNAEQHLSEELMAIRETKFTQQALEVELLAVQDQRALADDEVALTGGELAEFQTELAMIRSEYRHRDEEVRAEASWAKRDLIDLRGELVAMQAEKNRSGSETLLLQSQRIESLQADLAKSQIALTELKSERNLANAEVKELEAEVVDLEDRLQRASSLGNVACAMRWKQLVHGTSQKHLHSRSREVIFQQFKVIGAQRKDAAKRADLLKTYVLRLEHGMHDDLCRRLSEGGVSGPRCGVMVGSGTTLSARSAALNRALENVLGAAEPSSSIGS